MGTLKLVVVYYHTGQTSSPIVRHGILRGEFRACGCMVGRWRPVGSSWRAVKGVAHRMGLMGIFTATHTVAPSAAHNGAVTYCVVAKILLGRAAVVMKLYTGLHDIFILAISGIDIH